jgi:hypothetical protein
MLDLWPADIGTSTVTPPVAILREQATVLANKTKSLVEGEVTQVAGPTTEKFFYAFYIVGPALGGYRYRLLTITFPVEMYPVDVVLEPEILTHVQAEVAMNIAESALHRLLNQITSAKVTAESEEEFKTVLKAVFNAPKTRRVIEAIMAQSTT